MGRIYVVHFNGVTISALQDLFEVLAATDSLTKVLGWTLGQTSDVGDAAEEILRIETVRGIGSVAGGSGGTAPTPHPLDDGDAAFGGTVEANNTTRLAVGTGTLEGLEQYTWNVRIPWVHYFLPEDRPVIGPAEFWTLSLPAAPLDALTVSGQLKLEEIGG